MNFARDVVDAAPADRCALVTIDRAGARRELSFGEVAERSARLAGSLVAHGAHRGDVVMTLAGNRPEWALTMVACWRIGAVALPCAEMLRPGDLRARMDAVEPRVVVAHERGVETVLETGFRGALLQVPDERLFEADPVPAADLDPLDPALVVFTSGTSGEPKPVRHGQRYLAGQAVQAEHWLGALSLIHI